MRASLAHRRIRQDRKLSMRHASPRFLPPLASLVCGLSLSIAPAAAMHSGHSAASTSTIDTAGTTVVVTNCNDSGPGSLRAVVAGAIGSETIDMRGLSCRRIDLTGAIAIPQISLTLLGGGITIDANHTSQVFRHEGSGWLRISGMTIARGRYRHQTTAWGGCIYSEGSVELRHVLVHWCSAEKTGDVYGSAEGGGIHVSMEARLLDSNIVDNKAIGANGSGGGVYGGLGVFVRRSRISRNLAQHDSGGVFASAGLDANYTTISDNSGCALTAFGNSVIANSTISGNHDCIGDAVTMSAVGASWFDLEPMIINTTISGNHSLSSTVLMHGRFGSILNSTITFNKHDGGPYHDACATNPAVLLSGGWDGPTQLESTIAANSTCLGAPSPDIGKFGSNRDLVVVGANNLVMSSTMLQLPRDTIFANPRLAPLANNGGPTRTHALLSASPAIGKGNNNADLDYDQRGPRFQRVKRLRADIGAYEH
jgi:hypothetical protein